MMICAADFEDLFPDLFHPETAPSVQPTAKAPSAECIARWEDDGGMPLQASPPRHVPHPGAAFGHDVERMATAGAIAAAAPAAATYAAAGALFSAYAHLTARRDVRV